MSSARSMSPCSFSMTRAITSISGSASPLVGELRQRRGIRVDQLIPALGLGREALDLGPDPFGFVIFAVRLEPPTERRALVAQLLFVVLGEPLHPLLARRRDLRWCRRSWISSTRTSSRGSSAASYSGISASAACEVLLVDREHLLERAHRAIRLLQLVTIEHRDLHPELELVASLPVSTSRSSTRMYSSILPRGVERLRARPPSFGDVQLLERVLGAPVVLLDRRAAAATRQSPLALFSTFSV